MMAWVLMLQAGVWGDPDLEKIWELHEQGDTSAALAEARSLDVGEASPASCIRAELAERASKTVEAWKAVRRCISYLNWELSPSEHYVALQDKLADHVTAIRVKGREEAWIEGEKVTSWPFWVERGAKTTLTFEGGESKTVEAWQAEVIVDPGEDADQPSSVVVHGNVAGRDVTTNTTTVNNYGADGRPPGAFPLRASLQITGGLIALTGASVAAVGLVNFFGAQSDANRNAEYTNANGGCPDAGPRCDDWDEAVERRDSARRTATAGGIVAGAGAATFVLSLVLPKWVGGRSSQYSFELQVTGSF